MKYCKMLEDGYIYAIGYGNGDAEITKEEYESILAIINARPDAPEGKGYRLKQDLTWEEYDLPQADEEEISAEEAVNIILEGNTL